MPRNRNPSLLPAVTTGAIPFLVVVVLVLVLLSDSTARGIETPAPPSPVRIAVIADNQFHLPTAHPYYLESAFADGFVSVAVRTPHSAVFAPFAFEAVVRDLASKRNDLILHLGDAADISCPQEFDRFLETMASATKASAVPWLFAPGNHDGYFVGNSQHMPSNDRWSSVCGGTRLDKAGVISRYVKARYGIALQPGTILERTVQLGRLTVRLAALVDENKPHQSFVLQQVRLPTQGGRFVRLLVLDSSTYKYAPKFLRGVVLPVFKVAGVTGELGKEQRARAEHWLADDAANDDLLVAGHHPLKVSLSGALGTDETLGAWWADKSGLAASDSNWVVAQLRALRGLGYLSAHTHHGGTRVLYGDIHDLNVASLIDWPMGYRQVEIAAGHLISAESPLDAVSVPFTDAGSCAAHWADWAPKRTDFNWYTRYHAEMWSGVTGRIMHHYVLLAELFSLHAALPKTAGATDPKLAKWFEELEGDRGLLAVSVGLFKKRFETSSLAEIAKLTPKVNEGLAFYAARLGALKGKDRDAADLYAWCQLAWAAEKDFNQKSRWTREEEVRIPLR